MFYRPRPNRIFNIKKKIMTCQNIFTFTVIVNQFFVFGMVVKIIFDHKCNFKYIFNKTAAVLIVLPNQCSVKRLRSNVIMLFGSTIISI